LIAVLGPTFSPVVNEGFVVPGAFFLLEAIWSDLSGGEHDMNVGLFL